MYFIVLQYLLMFCFWLQYHCFHQQHLVFQNIIQNLVCKIELHITSFIRLPLVDPKSDYFIAK